MTTEIKLIKELYKGLKNFYEYASNLDNAIDACGDTVADVVYDNMPEIGEDNFDNKACRFLLSEVEDYLNDDSVFQSGDKVFIKWKGGNKGEYIIVQIKDRWYTLDRMFTVNFNGGVVFKDTESVEKVKENSYEK